MTGAATVDPALLKTRTAFASGDYAAAFAGTSDVLARAPHLLEARVIRRKTPLPLDHSLLGSKEEMLAELRAVRERSLAFLEETKRRDLSAYCWPHAFLGVLNIYEWFEMIAAHQLRHTKQIREIAAALPKVVGNSQK